MALIDELETLAKLMRQLPEVEGEVDRCEEALDSARSNVEYVRDGIAEVQKRVCDLLMPPNVVVKGPALSPMNGEGLLADQQGSDQDQSSQASAPDAALVEDAERILNFGEGAYMVDTGFSHGKPAVFVEPVEVAGEPNTFVPKDIAGPLDKLRPGAVAITFPTMEQAEAAADLFCGGSPPPAQSEAPSDPLRTTEGASEGLTSEPGEAVGFDDFTRYDSASATDQSTDDEAGQEESGGEAGELATTLPPPDPFLTSIMLRGGTWHDGGDNPAPDWFVDIFVPAGSTNLGDKPNYLEGQPSNAYIWRNWEVAYVRTEPMFSNISAADIRPEPDSKPEPTIFQQQAELAMTGPAIEEASSDAERIEDVRQVEEASEQSDQASYAPLNEPENSLAEFLGKQAAHASIEREESDREKAKSLINRVWPFGVPKKLVTEGAE